MLIGSSITGTLANMLSIYGNMGQQHLCTLAQVFLVQVKLQLFLSLRCTESITMNFSFAHSWYVQFTSEGILLYLFNNCKKIPVDLSRNLVS